MDPPHIEQSKTETGGCNNNSPKLGVGKANIKTKEQGHSGKKSVALFVGTEVRDQGNGRCILSREKLGFNFLKHTVLSSISLG